VTSSPCFPAIGGDLLTSSRYLHEFRAPFGRVLRTSPARHDPWFCSVCLPQLSAFTRSPHDELRVCAMTLMIGFLLPCTFVFASRILSSALPHALFQSSPPPALKFAPGPGKSSSSRYPGRLPPLPPRLGLVICQERPLPPIYALSDVPCPVSVRPVSPSR